MTTSSTPLTHFSLFSGIGGLDLAAEWAGFQTVGQVEKGDYANKILGKHWPNVPRWEDIKDVTIHTVREAGIEHAPTVLSGGFPCQPFSCAGQRRGAEDDRYLWPEMLRVVQELRPAWVVGENVAGFVPMGLDDALADLADLGYAGRAFVLPACAVGALHERKRVFVVARRGATLDDPEGGRCGLRRSEDVGPTEEPLDALTDAGAGISIAHTGTITGQKEDPRFLPSRGCGRSRHIAPGGGVRQFAECAQKSVADPAGILLRGEPSTGIDPARYRSAGAVCNADRKRREERDPAAGGGELGFAAWRSDPFGNLWTVEPDVGRVADGVPARVDRLVCLGNAVVPQQVFPIFEAIAAIEGGVA